MFWCLNVFQRLAQQHHTIRVALGGIFPEGAEEAVRLALAERKAKSESPAILDVGSGPGLW